MMVLQVKLDIHVPFLTGDSADADVKDAWKPMHPQPELSELSLNCLIGIIETVLSEILIVKK
jgi:hypothetical protein